MLRLNVLGGLNVTADGRQLAGAAAQPRRLAVLALLAAAGMRGTSREALIALLWPDHDEERGRHALTQSLYSLRRDLGAEALFLGQKVLSLNSEVITTDIAEFHAAIRDGAWERAVECWGGPFLQGFQVPTADGFDRWAEEQRAALGHDYARALDLAAARASDRGDFSAAVGFLRKRAAHEPLNAQVAVRLMEGLAAQGEVAAALQHARVHEMLMQQELELPPDRAVTALAERLRSGARAPVAQKSHGEQPAVSPETAPPAAMLQQATAAPHEPASPRRPLVVPAMMAVIILILAVMTVLVLPRRSRPAAGAIPVFAIGHIADYTGARPAGVGGPLADMLATNLARSSGLRVISTARMLELTRQLAAAGDTSGVVSAAARQAGAGELVDGSLYALAPNRLRLDLRRVDLASGTVIRAYQVEGADLFALADSGTAHLVREFGGLGPSGSLADVSTTSVEAFRLYEEGLRRFYNNESTIAERRFRQALDLDPEFAQAAFYYARSTTSSSRTETMDRLRRAVELAKQAGDRERLVIEAEWAVSNASPALLAIAETLMVRYPEEVDGYYYAGHGAILNGEYLKAVAPFRRLLELDSLALRSAGDPRCRACDAYSGLATVYYAMDSVGLMRQLVREWVHRQPGAAAAWRGLAQVYVAEHEINSALTALRIADSLEPGNPANRRYLISVRGNNEDYADAEGLLRAEIEGGPIAFRRQAQWDLAVVLRQVGRLREGLELARDYRRGISERLSPGAAPFNALLEAQIRFEQGDLRAAAALFDSIAVGQEGDLDSTGRHRDRIWAWAHEASVLAELRDTVRLTRLADSMEILGRGLVQARERNLHGHVRGLLARVQGRDGEAEQWFRRAMVSPVVGLTRTNYELAAVYLRTHRPMAAVGILGSAVRAGTVGPALYVTRTDLLARMAAAFDAAGQRDSALHYYSRVARAWERADPQVVPRRDSVRAAIMQLKRPASR